VFRLKGSGWYETDFKSEKDSQRNLVAAEREEAKPAADAKGEAKPEAKPETKRRRRGAGRGEAQGRHGRRAQAGRTRGCQAPGPARSEATSASCGEARDAERTAARLARGPAAMNRARQVAQARFGRALRRYFINGLLIWVPVLVTVLVVRFILDLMDQTLLVLPPALRPEALFGRHVLGLGALLALLIVFLTGLLVTNFVGRALVAIGEDLLERVPFVRALYSGVKSFSETVFSKSGSSFKNVLLVEYPRAGLWSMGFQTTDHLDEINERLGEPQVVRVHSDHAQSHLGVHRVRAPLQVH